MGANDELLDNARTYAARFHDRDLPTAPARHMAVLCCMDSRIDLFAVLGLRVGESHVIRNAGGLATDDAIRSLSLSQHLLGTREVMVIQHTRCGLASTSDEDFLALLPEPPPWSPGAFTDVETSVRETVSALRETPFLPHRDAIRGLVFDVDAGELREVT
jgi:carbonic anhydrase